MNYFQEYERIKKAKSSIQVGSKWIITQSTTGIGGTNTVGRTVRVRSVNVKVVEYSYEYEPPSEFSNFFYERPIDVFKRTFSPRL
jgi:hypothetical protein